jgi:hypothetical protein
MQTVNAVKKLEKAGFQVTITGNRCTAVRDSQIVGFYSQEGSVTCIRQRRKGDEDCAMVDYSAGVFCDSIAQAIKLAH